MSGVGHRTRKEKETAVNYYDDFYNEPSEFERQIYEFKQSLVKAVKAEYQAEMELLRKENAELANFKSRKDELERAHRETLREFEVRKVEIERDAKRMRLVELLGDNMIIGWFAKTKYTEKPKCNLCDEIRQINYTKPSGAKASEPCYVCGSADKTLVPEEIEVYKLIQRKRGFSGKYPKIERYYTRKGERDYDSFEACRDAYTGEPFEEVNEYRMVFLTLEDCQNYCDWHNSGKGVADD